MVTFLVLVVLGGLSLWLADRACTDDKPNRSKHLDNLLTSGKTEKPPRSVKTPKAAKSETASDCRSAQNVGLHSTRWTALDDHQLARYLAIHGD
jgi:hypothetical protein